MRRPSLLSTSTHPETQSPILRNTRPLPKPIRQCSPHPCAKWMPYPIVEDYGIVSHCQYACLDTKWAWRSSPTTFSYEPPGYRPTSDYVDLDHTREARPTSLTSYSSENEFSSFLSGTYAASVVFESQPWSAKLSIFSYSGSSWPLLVRKHHKTL